MKNFDPEIWQGLLLGYPKRAILGRQLQANIVAVCNALLNLEIIDADSNDFTITKDRAVLKIKRQAAATATAGSSGWRGLYDPAPVPDYAYGDVVMIPPGSTFDDGTIIPGIYVCNSVGAPTAIPKHPLQAGYDQSQWVNWQTWPTRVSSCDSEGNPITLIVDGREETEP